MTYSSAIRTPNMLTSNPIATSFTSGEAIRNDRVTPIGTPAETNPMNAGTALHEQNGLTTPAPPRARSQHPPGARPAGRGCVRR